MDGFSIWHWIIVLVVLSAIVSVVAALIRVRRQEQGVLQPGFKGWLLLLAIGVWLAPLRLLVELANYYNEAPTKASWEVIRGAMTAELAANLLTIAVAVVTLVCFARKSAMTKVVFLVTYLVAVVVPLLDYVLVAVAVASQNLSHSGLTDGLPELIGGWAKTVIGGGIWTIYMFRSRRVALTFTR